MKVAASRRLLLLVVASSFLLFAHASNHQLLQERKPQLQLSLPSGGGATTTTPTSTATTSPTTTPPAPTTSATTTPTPTPPTSTTPTSTSQTTTSSPPTTSQTTSTHDTATTQPPSQLPLSSSAVVTTNSDGLTITSVIVITPSSSSSTPSATQSSSTSDSSGLGTGSIIGLSVAGGVAVIAIVSFFVWKFTRKRFADFDDHEAIKWPELNNTHSGGDVHAMPTNSTGRAGFGAEHDSELNLARAPSPGGYAHSVGATSVPETYSPAQDPYAVPPLPHLNPNQPYHDDPGAYNQPGYYDPYRGPVPNTFGDGFSDGHGPEAIPMTRMAARTRSPGPQMAYDVQGRASPGPQAAMGYGLDARSASPAIGAGRVSPGPQAAYGYGPR